MRAGRVRPLRASDMKKDVRILLVGERESAPCPASQPRCPPPSLPALPLFPALSLCSSQALSPSVSNARPSRCESCRLPPPSRVFSSWASVFLGPPPVGPSGRLSVTHCQADVRTGRLSTWDCGNRLAGTLGGGECRSSRLVSKVRFLEFFFFFSLAAFTATVHGH